MPNIPSTPETQTGPLFVTETDGAGLTILTVHAEFAPLLAPEDIAELQRLADDLILRYKARAVLG